MKKVKDKREQEKRIVAEMISLYCRKNHRATTISHNTTAEKKQQLCSECQSLLAYAEKRSNHCPFMEEKTFCSNCKVHCYREDMREKIRTVMRFSGPRILFSHPILALQHLIASKREQKKQ